MLKLIPGNITILNVKDDIECEKFWNNVSWKKLKFFEDNSWIAGLDRKNEVKKDSKKMLRHNIDITLRLVNGIEGANINSNQDANNGEEKSIDIQFNNEIHKIEPVVNKFEML